MLQGGDRVDHEAIELDDWGEHDPAEATNRPGACSPSSMPKRVASVTLERAASELLAMFQELGASTNAVVTHDEDDLFEALRGAVATRRCVVLLGGDGSLHAAANAPLSSLPESGSIVAGWSG